MGRIHGNDYTSCEEYLPIGNAGILDTLQEMKCLCDFAQKFDAQLTISENSEHAFMEENDFKIVQEWLDKAIRSGDK